jgi:hypothetical protein
MVLTDFYLLKPVLKCWEHFPATYMVEGMGGWEKHQQLDT